jgi:hypothetical protein
MVQPCEGEATDTGCREGSAAVVGRVAVKTSPDKRARSIPKFANWGFTTKNQAALKPHPTWSPVKYLVIFIASTQ